MIRKSLVGGSLLVALFALGCGAEVGNDGAKVGGSCVGASDCSVLARCLTGAHWPAGYCATACESDADCPSGSVCADTDMGICVVSCAAAADCRGDDGYSCASLPARGAGGSVMGCAFTE